MRAELRAFIVHLIGNGLALVVLSEVLPGQVSYQRLEAVAIFALILGLLNALVRPVLQILALPLTCLTLGLFALILNAALFYLAARLSFGIDITYLGALAGTIVASLLNGVLSDLLRDR